MNLIATLRTYVFIASLIALLLGRSLTGRWRSRIEDSNGGTTSQEPAAPKMTVLVTFPHTGPAKWYQAVAGSGDKQAKAKLCRLEIEEVAVAFGPPA